MSKVLLVDDDELIAESLRQLLVSEKWDVDVAVTPAAARELMQSTPYRVILIDPFLTGSRNEDRALLMMNARHLQPDATLIILTAYSSAAMERVAADCRVTALIAKPQPVMLLGEVIGSLLRAKSASA